MDARRRERLIRGGVDVDGALERFMGSEALLERFLGKFPQDPNYEALERAVAAGDWEGALTASHTLKGVCGNLSMGVLYDLFTRQVAAIRAGDTARASAIAGDALIWRAVGSSPVGAGKVIAAIAGLS